MVLTVTASMFEPCGPMEGSTMEECFLSVLQPWGAGENLNGTSSELYLILIHLFLHRQMWLVATLPIPDRTIQTRELCHLQYGSQTRSISCTQELVEHRELLTQKLLPTKNSLLGASFVHWSLESTLLEGMNSKPIVGRHGQKWFSSLQHLTCNWRGSDNVQPGLDPASPERVMSQAGGGDWTWRALQVLCRVLIAEFENQPSTA